MIKIYPSGAKFPPDHPFAAGAQIVLGTKPPAASQPQPQGAFPMSHSHASLPSPKGSCTRKRSGQPSSIKTVRARLAEEADRARKEAHKAAREAAAERHDTWLWAQRQEKVDAILNAMSAKHEADGTEPDVDADRRYLMEGLTHTEFQAEYDKWVPKT